MKKFIGSILFFLVASITIMNQGSMSKDLLGPVLKYYLKAQESYATDQPINISFSLENVSDDSLWILTWYTPLEGLKGKILIVTCDGKEIPYEGPMVKRGDPTREDYIHIGPGEVISAEVDLSLAYNLDQPEAKECQVEFKGRVYDIIRDGVLLPRRRDEHRGMDIPGNRVDFRLISR